MLLMCLDCRLNECYDAGMPPCLCPCHGSEYDAGWDEQDSDGFSWHDYGYNDDPEE